MNNETQKTAFKAAQEDTAARLAELPMAGKMQILSSNNNHPNFKIYSNDNKSLTGLLHCDHVSEGFEPNTQDKLRGR